MSDQPDRTPLQLTTATDGANNDQITRIELTKAVKISINEPQGASKFWLPLVVSSISLIVSTLNFSVSNIYVHHKILIASTASDEIKYQRPALRDRDGNLNEVIDLIFINEGTVTESILTASLFTAAERVMEYYGSQDPFTLKAGESKLVELTIPAQDVANFIKIEGAIREIRASITYVAEDEKVRSSQFRVTTLSKPLNIAMQYKLDTPSPAPFVLFNNWKLQIK